MSYQSGHPKRPWWKQAWVWIVPATGAGAVVVPFVVTMATLETNKEIADESIVTNLLGTVINNQEKRAEDIGKIKADLGTVTVNQKAQAKAVDEIKDKFGQIDDRLKNVEQQQREVIRTTNELGDGVRELENRIVGIGSKQDELIRTTNELGTRVANIEEQIKGGLIVNVPADPEIEQPRDSAPRLPS